LVSDKKQEELTTSICQAALRSFSESDDSLAGIIEHYEIKVRDFMLLSLLCDQESFDDDQLERALGLDRQSISQCIGRLDHAGLVKRNGFGRDAGRLAEVRTTAAGRVLAQRVFDCMN
jgi:DNA-binding MarR family transcriptional regulator